MSKAVYIQKGESLDYKNNGTEKIAAGDVVLIGTLLGVAGCDIAVGEVGSVHVTGVYKLAKTSSNAITMGTEVYYDGTGITEAAESNTRVGYAAAGAATTDSEILVKLIG